MSIRPPLDLEALYQAALARWGSDAQYDQAVEECAELITALKHFRRKRIDIDALADELADVTLMIGQLTWMIGEDRVGRAIEGKIEKLKRLLAEGPENPNTLQQVLRRND